VAAFVAGFEVGLWQRPVDEDLLSPGGAQAEREAGEVLAALIAEREAEVETEEQSVPHRLSAPPLAESLDNLDAAPPEPLAAAEDPMDAAPTEAAAAEAVAASAVPVVTLTARDDTVAPVDRQPEPEPEPEPEPAVAAIDVPEVAEAIEEPPPAVEEPPPAEPVVADAPAGPGPAASALSLPTMAAGRTGFTVQLAAYETPSEAGSLIKSLQNQGFDAFHQQAQVGDKTWYRVRVGLHGTRASAEKEAARLAKASPFTPYVTSHP
jgi:cell division septation protein DedD